MGVNKLLKVAASVLGGLVVVGAVAVTTVVVKSNGEFKKTYAVTPRPVAIPTDAAGIARGKHLAETRGCNDCHGKDYAGAKVIEDGAMGRVFAPNLTPGKGSRVGSFKDEDWVRAIRHGVGPDGHGLFVMPSFEYSHFGDDDLGALIAFMKTVAPVDRDRVPIELGPVSRALVAFGKMKFAAAEIDHANVRPATVPVGPTVEFGRYVATSCTGCHGANFSGGKIDIGPPSWPQAANLTAHAESNLAKWSESDFINTVRTAKRPDGTDLDPVMPRAFGQMNDIELKALYAFFKSLPPVAKGVR